MLDGIQQPDIDQRLIEDLSRSCRRDVPRHQIEQLYRSVWSDLAATAKITNFLDIIAKRRTADLLREIVTERAQKESSP